MPQAADLRQVAVLSKNDFARIQYLLQKQQLEKEAAEQAVQEREAIRQRSKEITDNWDNTLKVCDHLFVQLPCAVLNSRLVLFLLAEEVPEETGGA